MSVGFVKNDNKLAEIGADVRMFWGVGLTIGILLCQSKLALTILAVLLSLLSLFDSGMASRYRKFIWIGFPAIIMILVIHLFYHEGEILFRFWKFSATEAGIREGALNSLRFVNFGLVALATLGGIEAVDFGRRIAWGLGLFRWNKLKNLSLVFFIAIRFMPSFVRETDLVKIAMRSRGADFRGSPVDKARIYIRLLLPLLSRVIRQADDIACAISLKGYQGEYLTGRKPSLRAADVFLIVIGAIIVVVLALL
ncbi:MAG: hypothetical protein GX409_05400 [candidate division Zixibacteria bacterium]|jgi:energy-coupling factor transport system permease protein|nr:hypothetical protein [candidate division Zixibacteria bacterium]